MKILKKAGKVLLYIILVLLFLALVLFLYMKLNPAFGAKTKGRDLELIKKSPQFQGGLFHNLAPLQVSTRESDEGFWKTTLDFFFSSDTRRVPKDIIPSKKLDQRIYQKNYPNDVHITWLGHSTILMRTADKTIITDPILSKRASPSRYVGPKKFPSVVEYKFEDLPKIDIVLISHDHYDHLDYETVRYLSDKVSYFYIPLGVKAHLLRWGVPVEKIQVFDWYDEKTFGGILFAMTPARHFSGRTLTDNRKTLWASWVIHSGTKKIFFGGDSGYFSEFRDIGEKYGPFDIAFTDCGAYNKNWSQVHMFPEESIQAAKDLQAAAIMPIHNSKFNLSLHDWDDPLNRIVEAGKKGVVPIVTPIIGSSFTLNSELPRNHWWEFLD
jgi:L-ascorbate metabolism protein UlaG (beta-lactamase superfamily)